MTEEERQDRCGCHPAMAGPCNVCRRAGRTERAVPCGYRGTEAIRRAGSNAEWRTCGHPLKPLGPLVCVCDKKCGPKCAGYAPPL